MNPACFLHVWTAGAWEQPVEEIRAALEASGFPTPPHIGLVGPRESRLRVLAALGAVEVAVEADSGWEQVTLAALHEYAQTHDQPILYCHSKGASDPAEWKVAWRRSMVEHVITRWEDALRGIEAGADLAGAHWIDDGTPPHFSGNFWLASAAYLRTLPPCATGDRMDAEFWVGQNEPSTFNMRRGNPMGMFR
jgi:hypothetical protein